MENKFGRLLPMCYFCAMNVQNNRSYAKESTKTTPSGIRFDKEQLEFVQKKEPKLTTKQKVVDFLLNKFWWEHKVATPSHKGLPPNEIMEPKSAFLTPTTYEEPKSPITGLPPKLSDLDKFAAELRKAKSRKEVEAIMKASAGGIMFPKERFELKAIADEVTDSMFND